MTATRKDLTMGGEEYKQRCLALGFSSVVLAELLGISRYGLNKRWALDAVVRSEAILALEALEYRVISARNDKILKRKRYRAT